MCVCYISALDLCCVCLLYKCLGLVLCLFAIYVPWTCVVFVCYISALGLCCVCLLYKCLGLVLCVCYISALDLCCVFAI